MTRPLEVAVTVPGVPPGTDWRALARRIEAAGFDVLQVPDHVAPRAVPPLLAVAAALAATTDLLGGTLVLNNELRHPASVAREAASIGLLTGGRFQLGLGAGYGRATAAAAGQPHRRPAERIERLDEAIELIRKIWTGNPVTHEGRHYRVEGHECGFAPPQPVVPILVGGNGPGTLAVAARRADAVGFIGVSPSEDGPTVRPSHLTHQALRHQIEAVEQASSGRPEPARTILVQDLVITEDPIGAATKIQRWLPAPVEELLDSPYLLIGTEQSIAERLHHLHEEYGIVRITVFASAFEAMAGILETVK